MFESLQERLGSILGGLTGRGALSEKDVSAAMREVRRALLEADVALEVVKEFTDKVREKAVGAEVLKSIKPGQMVVKIVHDELVAMLGEEGVAIDLNAPGQQAQWDVVGPVCETGDFLGKARTLTLNPGDLLAMFGAGAYGFTMSSNYNSRGRAAEVMVDGDNMHLIRSRETFADLIRHETRLPAQGGAG